MADTIRHLTPPLLGVCWYPEQWPEARWAGDAQAMAAMGLGLVRIAEFAWSRIEPTRDAFAWDWLDRAIETLAAAGLRVMMSTPTAAPPKWLVDERPEILPHDATGRPRGFGSRRHCCLSSPAFIQESARITTAVAARYGRHPAVIAWHLDNEYGNHRTILSWAPHVRPQFQAWLERRYGRIEALREAWGTVFWSQDVAGFGDIDLPAGAVTRANQAQQLDFRRFSSDQVVAYNRLQRDIVRSHSPGRPITHNFMGYFWEFDHFAVADDLDLVTVNNYPLLATDTKEHLAEAERIRWQRSGHPDAAGFLFDLARGQAADGRWGVIEGQAGPLDAGTCNAVPAPGMVRLWTHEAFAHGASLHAWFRWRQAPFAQEQWLAGLQLPDGTLAPGGAEAAQATAELRALAPVLNRAPVARADVALVLDYQAAWVIGIQPHGLGFEYPALVRQFYAAARQLDLDVDVVRPGASLDDYALVLVPSLPIVSTAALSAFQASTGALVFGPRSGSKTAAYQVPDTLAPGPLQALIDLRLAYVESLRPDFAEPVEMAGRSYACRHWREYPTDAQPPAIIQDSEGRGLAWRQGRVTYLGLWPEAALLCDLLEPLAIAHGLSPRRLPEALRRRRRGRLTFAFNYGATAVPAGAEPGAVFHLGGPTLAAHDVAIFEQPQP